VAVLPGHAVNAGGDRSRGEPDQERAHRGGPGRDQEGEMGPDERSSGKGIFEKPGTNAL